MNENDENFIVTWLRMKIENTILCQLAMSSDNILKSILYFFIVSFPVLLQAQSRELSNDSDTVFMFDRSIKQFCEDLEIPTIDKSNRRDEIRFWDDYKVVRLWNEEDQIQGEVIFFVYQHKEADAYNKYLQGKVYFQKMPLDDLTIRFIEYMIVDFSINQIPSENLIENWPDGNDGSLVVIESCSFSTYTFKYYSLGYIWLQESRNIQYFFSQLNNIGEIEREFEKFIEKQPFGIYRNGWSQTDKGYSSFLSKWGYLLFKKLFGRMNDRRLLRKRLNAEKDS